MNEGESAGGGHQGTILAPPAVSDRISTVPIVPPTTSATNNSSSSNQIVPSTITIVTSNAAALGVSSPTATTVASVSVKPRSFQQVFTQQQLVVQHQKQSPQTGIPPIPTITTRIQQQQQYQQLPQLHMPQTPGSRFTTGLASGANSYSQKSVTIQSGPRSYTPPISAERTFVATTVSATLSVAVSPLFAKRQKIEIPVESAVSSTAGSIPSSSFLQSIGPGPTADSRSAEVPSQDIISLKKRILEHKYQRLRGLKERHSENVAELHFLHSGGNMMDYPAWRKKPTTPQFATFSNAYRLDKLINEEKTTAIVQLPTVDNIARVIGVSGSFQQQQQGPGSRTVATTKTNTQSHIPSVSILSTTGNLKTSPILVTTSGIVSVTSGVLANSEAIENVLPQGAEIKIPAVGATPVAVSTKLPAAVVQLSQQGHIPGRPLGGRHGMVFGQIPAPPAVGNSSVPLVPGGTPLVPCTTGIRSTTLRRNANGISQLTAASPCDQSSTTPPPPLYSPSPTGLLVTVPPNANTVSNSIVPTLSLVATGSCSNNAQEFSFKAKQEVYVMQRISELQREGLWTEKRLPKLQEPGRSKAHWDYLLEEMVWLAADFAQERKWKKNAAKKCAKMVQKYFQDKANAAQKAEKAQEIHLKRIAAFISKEVKMFWSNVEKLVEYKHHTKIEEKRKKALDQHLSFIVDQTEKFSQQLVEGMNKTIMDTTTAVSGAQSMNSSRIQSPKAENMSDDEFRPESASEDDEETIAKAEEEAADVKEEVAALEKESQMDLDDFINDLPKGYLENRAKILLEEGKSGKVINEDDSDDTEFEANEASEDDENTIKKQEEEEIDIDHKKELDELEADNDLTVEQLLVKYKANQKKNSHSQTAADSYEKDPLDSDDDDDVDDVSGVGDAEDDTEDDSTTLTSDSDSEENIQEDGLKSLIEDTDATTNSKDDMIKDAAALAESIQPKGNTLSSTDVVTPVPFLLKHSLREYQHIGLDWLVTMNERKLNGILADEMGLGKTIQTIALLAHLACVKCNWGPHLIVVPSSVMLNWEMEFKKWCPGFKILTYYGTQKERKFKRVGWTKPNAFHVCITSYKLVVQDQQSFRRKKWKYLILDEAQNIKNFKSQRWQLLLNFSTERRLLLTGTPLQNDLMELWSLMHFLMPYVFSSHREFKEWFSNPMTGMIEGNMEYNESLINRLHKVIRPFLLRRLKKEVEKQMPKKYEHVVMCRLSNRQRYLYDDFMSRAKTKETLQTGNLLSVINVLMQLRKVCNHPNMFEVRPTISPFQMEGISFQTSRLACDVLQYDPFSEVDLQVLNLVLLQLEFTLTAYMSHKSRLLAPSRKLIEEVDTLPKSPPICPTGKYKFYIRVRDQQVQQSMTSHNANPNAVCVGASPTMKTEGNKLVPLRQLDPGNSRLVKRVNNIINPVYMIKPIVAANTDSSNIAMVTSSGLTMTRTQGPQQPTTTTAKIAKIVQGGKPYFLLAPTGPNVSNESGALSSTGGRLTLVCKPANLTTTAINIKKDKSKAENTALVTTLAQQVKSTTKSSEKIVMDESASKDESDGDDGASELSPIYNMSEVLQQRKEKRLARLKFMASVNRRRIEAVPIYGSDCRESIEKCVTPNQLLDYSSWHTRGYTNCRAAMERRDNWTLNKMLISYQKRCEELHQMFLKFILYVPSACAPRIQFYAQHLTATRVQQEHNIEKTVVQEMSPVLSLLHPIISPMLMQFPDPRLIQYDCGKLQILDRLLRTLKSGQHRVLIFTQMTKMLDVLEAFLNYHGHIYLRLDGSTRVEQRQVLMERFNGDKRIFCFILSTRSGGVGINLTGADTVIFYDSDWNPTMDAQAQDRCHRIGQTRDVHIYRLVSEKTIEVNILKKASQKRMLSDMAIEGGNFTTSYFKSSTIKDLFNMEQQEQDNDTSVAIVSRQEKPSTSMAAMTINESSNGGETDKQSLRAFESALAAAEDEQDVQATKTARAEAAADLAEFDETIPIDEVAADGIAQTTEMSKADLEMQNLVKQLTPIERYAMRFVEETGAAWTAEQLRAAEEEIEAQKREWEANRLAAIQKEEEILKQEAEAEEILTYNRKDANNQIWISDNTMERMPMWCPPTPPQGDNDVYIDYSLSFMYEIEPIPDSELPPVYAKRECKRSRTEAGFLLDSNRRSPKIRKEDNFHAPRSLFDRPSTAIARIRRDLKHQRYRGVFKPNIQIPGLKPQIPQKVLTEPEGMAEWCIFEDIAILNVLVNLQGLPCNLMLLSPGHTPNWDLVAEIVNIYSKTYRSPKQCRWRYESVIQPREEGKLVESPKKQKKLKTTMKLDFLKGPLRCLRTTQMYIADNNSSFTKLMRSRFDCIKMAYLKKAPPPKRHFSAPTLMNPKHLEVLQEFGISNYDQPVSPLNIALLKATKLRDKQRTQLPPPPLPSVCAHAPQQGTVSTPTHSQQPPPQQQLQEIVQQHQNVPITAAVTSSLPAMTSLHPQQLQIQHIPTTSVTSSIQHSTPTTFVLQHASTLPQSHQQQTMPTTSTQPQLMRSAIGTHAPTTQIVKAIVTPQSGLLTAGQMQQLTQQAASTGTQHVQLQQTSGGNLVGTPASVSMVLTTPVQTLSSSVQPTHHHNSGQVSTAQIVSISPQTIVSSSTQVGSIVQTLPSQSLPQVVSVSQLANVGTVLTTSANLQPSATITTLNPSALRAQRIVAATSGTLQDVVLQQRSGTPGPTIVSMSSLGQNVNPAQFQAAQLRLTPMSGTTQQVVTKGIPVTSLQQSGKISSTAGGSNQSAHIQLYRQRQQLKLLQATPGQNQTVLQTAGGQTTLVNAAGTIIQGNLLQATAGPTVQVQGQKVAVATVSSSNVITTASGGMTSVATVQVAHNQGRTQFIKQISGKQSIARQVGDNDMLLVKRQIINPHQKTQVLQQGQIFTTSSAGAANVQLHQQTQHTGTVNSQQQSQMQGSTQQVQQVTSQQIAALVKTSTGSMVASSSSGVSMATGVQTPGTVNMALSHLKPGGQIKVTMANQPQMRQLSMQQHLSMPRKISRMTQIAAAGQGNTAIIPTGQQVTTSTTQGNSVTTVSSQKASGGGSIQTQVVHIQNTKPLPSSVTVQQIQQVMRQGQPATLAATGLVLGKTSVGRVIPVSVGSQSNQRQTIQVVSAASAQALASGNLRAHVTGGQNITNTIKVASAGGNQSQTQQALITAIQQQAAAQQNQRQNASPVRLQTTAGGNLVAVVQSQTLQQQQHNVGSTTIVAGGTIASSIASSQPEVMTITPSSTGITNISAQQQPQQPTTPQQVRTLVKKKIMQIRSEKE